MLLQDTGNKRGSMCSPVGVFETKFREVPSVSVVDPLQLPLKGAHPALLSYCRFRERVRALSWVVSVPGTQSAISGPKNRRKARCRVERLSIVFRWKRMRRMFITQAWFGTRNRWKGMIERLHCEILCILQNDGKECRCPSTQNPVPR